MIKQLNISYRKMVSIVKSTITKKKFFLLMLPSWFFRSSGLNSSSRKQRVIVSLTSIPPRLSLVHLTVESIMRQKFLPDKIILWLSQEYKKEEFSNFDWKNLPTTLTKLQKRGLEIAFTDDMGSYHKFLPALRRFPKDIIITIDDDVFYHADTIESLYEAYLENGGDFIYCRRSRIMKLLSANRLAPYKSWPVCFSSEYNRKNLFFTGTGGVLYPPGIFDEEVFREDVFSKLAPSADDIWFNAMCLRSGKKVFQVKGREPERLPSSKVFPLGKQNFHNAENDVQLKLVFDKYDLYKKMNCAS